LIEVRTYEGDASELSAFLEPYWRTTYGGRLPVPRWSPALLHWQLTWKPLADRCYCLAAYERGRLIGTILCEGFGLAWHGREVAGSIGSWLTVAPEHRRAGVALQLLHELERRHRERGAVVLLGFVFRDVRAAPGRRFWRSLPDGQVTSHRLDFWARIIDGRALAAWEPRQLAGCAAVLVGRCLPSPGRAQDGLEVRDYRPDDLDACLALANALVGRVDVGILWQRDRLRHQLEFEGVPQTVVCEWHGRVSGFANFHTLELLGRRDRVLSVGIVDLLALRALPRSLQRRLLQAALRRLSESGCAAALVLPSPAIPRWPLVAAGFLPQPAEQSLITVRMQPDFDPGRPRSFHLIWR
jgi:GNAT superfamily N-acetyltransferase